MPLPFRGLSAVLACLLAAPAAAGVILTADVYDTPGLPGYQTFDLTASSPDGYLGTFGFYNGGDQGITGPLYQGGVGSPLEVFQGDRLYGDPSASPTDSVWFVDYQSTLAIGASQSNSGMYGAFAAAGSRGRDPQRNLPFARLVTNDPSAVRLSGEFVVDGYWSDGGSAGKSVHGVDSLLSDVTIGAAPVFDSFPDRPIAPAPVTPHPTYGGPVVSGPEDGQGVTLTASVIDTPGMPGFRTFDISVTTHDGHLRKIDLHPQNDFQGIIGPLHHGGPDESIESVLSNRLFEDGSNLLSDTRWLVPERVEGERFGTVAGGGESPNALTGWYANSWHHGSWVDDSRTIPFIRLVTDDPSAVRLNGAFAVDRLWDDGTDGGDLLYEVDYLLSDILVGEAPTDLTFPTRPAPPVVDDSGGDQPSIDPVVVVEPPGLDAGESGPVQGVTDSPIVEESENAPGENLPAGGDLIAVIGGENLQDPPISIFPIAEAPTTLPVRIDVDDDAALRVIDLTEFIIDPTDAIATGVWYQPNTTAPIAWVSNGIGYRTFVEDSAASGGVMFAASVTPLVPEPSAIILAGTLYGLCVGRRRA